MSVSLTGAYSSLADLLCSIGERVTRLVAAALALVFAPITQFGRNYHGSESCPRGLSLFLLREETDLTIPFH